VVSATDPTAVFSDFYTDNPRIFWRNINSGLVAVEHFSFTIENNFSLLLDYFSNLSDALSASVVEFPAFSRLPDFVQLPDLPSIRSSCSANFRDPRTTHIRKKCDYEKLNRHVRKLARDELQKWGMTFARLDCINVSSPIPASPKRRGYVNGEGLKNMKSLKCITWNH
jgi:hypothetical protein